MDIEENGEIKDKSFIVSQNINYNKRAILEAIIFIAGEPVSINILAKSIDIPLQEIKQLMDNLILEYKTRQSGILINQIEDAYQMITNPETGFFIKKFKNININNKLSQSALESLAIVAYKQPITKIEIDQLRGVHSEGSIKILLEKRLIKIAGRKETPGRPFLYTTTKDFLQYFGLKNLTDLPLLNAIA